MKKWIAGTAAVMMIVSLGACGTDKKAASSSSSSAATDANGALKTVTPDTLTIGTNLPAPGFWNGDDPDSIKGGLEYGIGQALAKKFTGGKPEASVDAFLARRREESGE